MRLPDELPSPELQKHRKKDPHPPAGRNGLKGPSQRSDPIPFQRYATEVRYLLLYLILLAGGGLFCPVSHSLQGRGQILLLTEGLSRFGKASKDYVGRKKRLERARVSPRSRARGLKIVIAGRFAHYCLHELRLSAAWAARSAGLS